MTREVSAITLLAKDGLVRVILFRPVRRVMGTIRIRAGVRGVTL